MIIIDEIEYDIPVVSLKRKSEVLDKYAERVESGDLKREIIGVYFNYELTFGRSSNNPSAYAALWLKLTEPVPFHTVNVPDDNGYVTFTAYFAGVSDELVKSKDDGVTNFWRNLTATFIAQSPARTP